MRLIASLILVFSTLTLTSCWTTGTGREPAAKKTSSARTADLEPSRYTPPARCEICEIADAYHRDKSLDITVDKQALCRDTFATIASPENDLIYKKINDEWEKAVESAIQRGTSEFAGEYGEYELSKVYIEELRRADLIVDESQTEAYFKERQKGNPSSRIATPGSKLCEEEVKGWRLEGNRETNLDSRVDELSRRRLKFAAKYKQRLKELFQPMPIAFLEAVLGACKTIADPKTRSPSKNANATATKFDAYLDELTNLPFCKNPGAARTLAADVTRRESIEFTDSEAEELAQKYLPLLMAMGSADLSYAKNELSQSVKDSVFEQKKLEATCDVIQTLESAQMDKIFEKLQRDMRNSVEYLKTSFGIYYSSWRKRDAENAFELARQGVLKSLSDLTSDEKLLGSLKESITKISFAWPEPEKWKTREIENWHKKKVLVIDEVATSAKDELWILREFLKKPIMNAAFQPVERRVYLETGVMWLFEKVPIGGVMVMAHEISHDIGPALAREGIEAEAMFAPALTCMASRASILLRKEQWEEASPDMVASVAMAKLFSAMPMEARPDNLARAAQFFNIAFMANSELNVYQSHPFDPFRTSGIIASSKSMRETLKCEAPGKYAVCF